MPRRCDHRRPIDRRLIAGAGATLALALSAPAPAGATPTLDQATAFARAELSRACSDPKKTRIDAIDQLAIGAGRTCRVSLTPGRLKLTVRQRGGDGAADYARMWLDIRFTRKSRFLCGPNDAADRATLFITCNADRIIDGAACASRKVTLARPDRDDYHAQKDLGSLALLKAPEQTCKVIARSLNFIGARTKAVQEFNTRDYFTATH